MAPIKSRRGVYYDLSKSPYEYITSYGEIFKFSSRKKLDMFISKLPLRIVKIQKNYNIIRDICNLDEYKIPDRVMKNILYVLYKEVEKGWGNTEVEERKDERI